MKNKFCVCFKPVKDKDDCFCSNECEELSKI